MRSRSRRLLADPAAADCGPGRAPALSRWRPAAAWLLAASLGGAAAHGQHLPIFNLTTDDGLAASQVWDVLRDRRGYLWIGTSEGLNRHDGVGLTSITAAEGLRNQVVRRVVEDGEGNLWLGTSDGLARYDGRGFSFWGRAEGVPGGIVWDLAFDRHGTLWFATGGGLGSLRDGQGGAAQVRWHTAKDGLAADDVYSLHVSRAGELWAGSRAQGAARCAITADGKLGPCRRIGSAEGLRNLTVRAIAEDATGAVYLGTRGGGVTRFDATGARTFGAADGLAADDVYALLVNRRGELVVGTSQRGVSICALPAVAPCRSFGKAHGLRTDAVLGLAEDAEGNLWIGLNNGLSRLSGESLLGFDDRHGVPGPGGYAVLPEADGGVWVGTFGGLARLRLARRYAPPQVERWTAAEGLPSSEIWDVLRDRRGDLWVGTARGLCRFDPAAGCSLVLRAADGLAGDYVLELHETRGGDLWVGTLDGASRLRFPEAGGAPEVLTLREADGLPAGQVQAISEAPDGTVWLGCTGGGLAAFAAGRVRAWRMADGLPSANLYGLHAADDGTLWIGTGGRGLVRARPGGAAGVTFEPVAPASGLDARVVSAIRPDGMGRLWIGSTSGVYRFDPRAARGAGRVVQHFDRRSGLISKDVSTGNSIGVDPAGRAWFGFSGGVGVYDPALTEPPAAAPVAVVERLTVGERVLRAPWSPPPRLAAGESWLAAGEELAFPPGGRNLRFEFRGLAYRERPRFRYQLVGFDPGWSAPSAEPFKEYTNLDPGDYRFRVQAAAGEGDWGPAAELAFTLAPALWQTPLFAAAVAVAAMLLLAAVHQARTRRIEARARELEAEVAERTDDLRRYARALEEHSHALDAANARIRQSNRFKTQFLANMSHELRTPLNAIIGFSQVLVRRLDGRVEERELGFLANVLDSGRHLLHLLNNLLDLSKIEAGKMEVHVEPAELAALVEGVCAVMEGYCRERDVTLVKSFPAHLTPIVVDVAKLKQVLFNLLSNAIKFSDPGGTVEVEARPLAAGDSSLGADSYEIRVVDRGVGIAPEDQITIFEEFRQVHHGGDRPAGTGLGLAIVHRFVTLLGGELSLESTPGEGTAFRVVLPRQAAEQRPGADEGEPEPAEVRPRVLVVADDRGTFGALAAPLEAAGYLPVRARDAAEAVRVGREVRPALVVLDLALPWEDHGGVLAALEGDEATARLPVVMAAVRDGRQVAFAAGFDDCLLAPVDAAIVLETVRRLSSGEGARPVLLVDDDPDSRELVELALAGAGLAGLVAGEARRAVELARAHGPRVVAISLSLPGGEGLRLARALRRDARTAKIPLVALVGRSAPLAERRQVAEELGAAAEGGAAELAAMVAAVLRRRG